MKPAKQQAFNAHLMGAESRNKAYAAINISWKKMRPDMAFADKDEIRDQRLAWMAQFLGLKSLDSTKDLSDNQIGLVLEEMRRMTGEAKPASPARPYFKGKALPFGVVESTPSSGAEIIHLASNEQIYVLEKLEAYIGWTTEQRENYLQPRFKRRNFRTLIFKQATALTMQMLNIAAHKDLKAQGKEKISRAQTAKQIPILKKKLGIDQ